MIDHFSILWQFKIDFNLINKLLIVDGDNYFYRLYSIHASNLKKELKINEIKEEHIPLLIEKTLPVFNYFKNLIKYNHYDIILFTFDKKGSKQSNFELLKKINKKYNLKDLDYKWQRIKNNNFIQYKRHIQNILFFKGYPIVTSNNYEADDVIATLVKEITMEFNWLIDIDILSNDKDIYQLLDQNVKIINWIWKKDLENKIDFSKFKIQLYNKYWLKLNKPEDIIYIKAIVGDKSDNIPWIKGVAEKTLAKELNQHNNNVFETDIYKNNKKLIDAFIPLIRLEKNIFVDDLEIIEDNNPNEWKVNSYIKKIVNKT